MQKTANSHKNVLISILVSQPGAKAQRIYQDFSSELLNGLRTEDMPFAIIVPLNEYCVFNVSDKGRTSTPVTIPVGYYARFRGDLRHAGGPIDLAVTQYRLHAYSATSPSMIPMNAVYF